MKFSRFTWIVGVVMSLPVWMVPLQALGVEPGYEHYFRYESPAGGLYDAYIYQGTHEEVYGTIEGCGPMEEMCDDLNSYWNQETCQFLISLYASGYEETVWVSGGTGVIPGEPVLAYFFAHEDPERPEDLFCNRATGTGIFSDSTYLNPLDTVARWALLTKDGGHYEQAKNVEISVQHLGTPDPSTYHDYVATFEYGSFNDLFTHIEDSCGLNHSFFCTYGQETTQSFVDGIMKGLAGRYAVDEGGTSDRFYLPFATADGQIQVMFDSNEDPVIDDCCETSTLGRDQPYWWVRLSPRPGGVYGNPICSQYDDFRAVEDSKGFDPLNKHSFPEGDPQFAQTYAKYPVDKATPFPKPDHDCKNSDYQGSLGLIHNSGSDKREHYTYLASNPRIIDLAKYDNPQSMLNALGGLEGTYTRHLKLIHSVNDKREGLPPVKFHYKLDYLSQLYNDGDGWDKYWYLNITPPGTDTSTELPLRNGTDEINEGASSDPDYCWQDDDHACRQGAFDQSQDHAFVIQPGTSALYLWQLAEADEVRPGEEMSIADARDEWYAQGSNSFDPNGDPEWFLFTNIVGILFNYSAQNDDDLLAASKFEISHGAAYALAVDFAYTSQSKPLPICRTAMRQIDEAVQKIYSGSESGCGSDKKTWILPVSKYDTRGTVFTNVWAEVME